ncbi:MAG: helix-turn-helix domain-containing protein [Clostridia bacterium]|nr:helix-turn-helix domain-containing protein [Clostridia bacterium]
MKHMELDLNDPNKLQIVARALSSDLRLKILELLNERSMNVIELAQKLEVPVSTVSNSIVILEEADLIRTERQTGVRGVMKLCSRKKDNIAIRLVMPNGHEIQSHYQMMPIGHYTDISVTPVCGLLSDARNIGEQDDVSSFYDQMRYDAQLLWFQQGYVEYRFSNRILKDNHLKCIEISFEACSEAPNYRMDWPSDISVFLNGVEIGTWLCPGDFGGRQGKFSPLWWNQSSTQYGILKRWRVDETGAYLDDVRISDVTLSDLGIMESPFIRLSIAVKKDAVHQGGINLFGEKFGDYNQAIMMRLDYIEK